MIDIVKFVSIQDGGQGIAGRRYKINLICPNNDDLRAVIARINDDSDKSPVYFGGFSRANVHYYENGQFVVRNIATILLDVSREMEVDEVASYMMNQIA